MLSNDEYSKAFHEIKNSITLINSSLQLLEKKHPEVKEYSLWKNSLQSLGYLRELILNLSLSRSNESVDLKPVNINILLEDILDSIQALKWESAFSCEPTIEANLPTIPADSCRLTQAIINLLKNAYEAMDKTGTCFLNAYRKDNHIIIDIIDSGGGIQPELQSQLFLPFTTSKPTGSGLGLSITKQIIENHNGTLSYESRDGDGCTFRIILPIEPNELPTQK